MINMTILSNYRGLDKDQALISTVTDRTEALTVTDQVQDHRTKSVLRNIESPVVEVPAHPERRLAHRAMTETLEENLVDKDTVLGGEKKTSILSIERVDTDTILGEKRKTLLLD